MKMGSVVHKFLLTICQTNVMLTWGEGPALVSVGWVTDGGGISRGIPLGTVKEQISSPISKPGPWRFSRGGGYMWGSLSLAWGRKGILRKK